MARLWFHAVPRDNKSDISDIDVTRRVSLVAKVTTSCIINTRSAIEQIATMSGMLLLTRDSSDV